MQRRDLAEQPAERAKAERIQTEKTIAAFSVLTERLDALAERTRRSWWWRLVG
jgi:hypothetical protein